MLLHVESEEPSGAGLSPGQSSKQNLTAYKSRPDKCRLQPACHVAFYKAVSPKHSFPLHPLSKGWILGTTARSPGRGLLGFSR